MQLLRGLKAAVFALFDLGKDNMFDVADALAVSPVKSATIKKLAHEEPWLLNRRARRTIDGAILEGSHQKAYAKYTLKKGLPEEEGQVRRAIENEPHLVDGFDGEIPEGYGKGYKSLLVDDEVPVKQREQRWLGRLNYHEHLAEKAGQHYDLVVEGVASGSDEFEFNIPRGPYKGRYAMRRTEEGDMVCIRMKDRGVQGHKNDYRLKDMEWLREQSHERFLAERKEDGSHMTGNVTGQRAAFRSHREGGETYYDKLPALEDLSNHSPFYLERLLFPGTDLDGTLFVGEGVHPDGAPRTGGILNSQPAKAQRIQELRGPVEYYAWDIERYKGKDISQLPAEERRAYLEEAIREARRYNKHWHVVERCPENESFADFYERVSRDPLPHGEGIVLKPKGGNSRDQWYKVKKSETQDLVVVGFEEGSGKYEDSLGAMVVEAANGERGKIGSFRINDAERQWIWEHRDELEGSVGKFEVQNMTERGVPRAGRFHSWHEAKGNETGLHMYAESLAGGDPQETEEMVYRLKSSAGWRH